VVGPSINHHLGGPCGGVVVQGPPVHAGLGVVYLASTGKVGAGQTG
jgi:hypothetical protein